MKLLKLKIAAFVTAFFVPTLAIPSERSQMLKGICIHWAPTLDSQNVRLDLAKNIGFDSIRIDMSWQQLEKSKGKYAFPAQWDHLVNEARSRGLIPLVILDYGNLYYDNGDKPRSNEAISGYVKYASEVVEHFKSRVKYYEIWNEWDGPPGGHPGGNASDYAALFKAAYTVLKNIDPNATFIAGAAGTGSEFERKLASAGVANLADGMAVHQYDFQIAGADGAELNVAGLQKMHAEIIAISGKKSVDFYVTEVGWPTHTGLYGRTENEVASLAAKTYLLDAHLPFVKGVWWYDLEDYGDDPKNKESRFGLVHSDLTPKPAMNLVQQALNKIK